MFTNTLNVAITNICINLHSHELKFVNQSESENYENYENRKASKCISELPAGSTIELAVIVDSSALHNENQYQHTLRDGKHLITATVHGDYLPHGITTIQV